MARFVARGIAVASSYPLLFSSVVEVPLFRLRKLASVHFFFATSSPAGAPLLSTCFPVRNHLSISACSRLPLPSKCAGESARGYRKERWRRRRRAERKKPPKERQPELDVMICIEEDLPEDPEIKSIAEMLRMDLPMAMALAFSHLDVLHYKTRDIAVNDVNKFETIKISLLLCNDDFIRKLNKDWRDEDHATDVLSMSQHIPELNVPILMLGDIVISIDTASRQAVERAHTLLDEMRILMVHGLLHLLGFDHEISDEAEEEMEKEEESILGTLGWKGKGLIKSAYDSRTDGCLQAQDLEEADNGIEKVDALQLHRQEFNHIVWDIDGRLLKSNSKIAARAAVALREAISSGVHIILATGKSRPAIVSVLEMADLAGASGIVSESSPGVFLQGLLVYGRQGKEIYRRNLDKNVCNKVFSYSLEHRVPVVAFSLDRCFTLFEHPLVDSLHEVYHEPRAELIPSIEQFLPAFEVQKLVFLDSAEGISSTLWPYWSKAVKEEAVLVHEVSGMLEIVPLGTSKAHGIELLLNHLGVPLNQVLAINDGVNGGEMVKLESLGITLANGSPKAKETSELICGSNEKGGVEEALYKHV